MSITHHFKGSSDSYGYGYFAYIEDGQLVLGENWPREGGVTYRGPYATAGHELADLMTKAPKLYSSIVKYYADKEERLRKQAEIREESKSTVSYSTIFRIKLFMDNGKEHICQVRGRFESDVIKKLTPPVPEVLVLQDDLANVFACRSEKISAIEFLDDKMED